MEGKGKKHYWVEEEVKLHFGLNKFLIHLMRSPTDYPA